MARTAVNHLIVEALAVGMVTFNSPSPVNANAYIEPVHCQRDVACVCKRLDRQLQLRYWICQWDQHARGQPVTAWHEEGDNRITKA